MKENISRVHSLDYLRGFMACAVMSYHFSSWTFGEFDASTILGRIGLYGVSFFYILSGLTLHIVYSRSPLNLKSLKLFGLKRIFRIYPLLWLVTIISVFAFSVKDFNLIFLNLTGLFGFIKPAAYIGTGVWSIGNELFFYAFVPLLIFLERRNLKLFYSALLIILVISLYFSFFLINSATPLTNQWDLYVNPLNQFFLFAGGMLIGHLGAHTINLKQTAIKSVLGLLVITFCIYPVTGDTVMLVSGWLRVLFSLICLLICLLIFNSRIEFNKLGHNVFSFLGDTSYSIYLLHPIVFKVTETINNVIFGLDTTVVMISSIAGTFLASHLSYNLLEKPMVLVGKSLSKNIN